eukprot:359740-Chlamydomonas_euryale.AAC.11
MGAWAYGRMGVWADGRMGAWAHGRMRAWVHGRMGVWAHGCMDARAYGRMGAWAHGRMGAWAHGRMGVWAHGRMGAWAYGRVGAWAHGRMGSGRRLLRIDVRTARYTAGCMAALTHRGWKWRKAAHCEQHMHRLSPESLPCCLLHCLPPTLALPAALPACCIACLMDCLPAGLALPSDGGRVLWVWRCGARVWEVDAASCASCHACQDPYLILKIGRTERRTNFARQGGKYPGEWESPINLLRVCCWTGLQKRKEPENPRRYWKVSSMEHGWKLQSSFIEY